MTEKEKIYREALHNIAESERLKNKFTGDTYTGTGDIAVKALQEAEVLKEAVDTVSKRWPQHTVIHDLERLGFPTPTDVMINGGGIAVVLTYHFKLRENSFQALIEMEQTKFAVTEGESNFGHSHGTTVFGTNNIKRFVNTVNDMFDIRTDKEEKMFSKD